MKDRRDRGAQIFTDLGVGICGREDDPGAVVAKRRIGQTNALFRPAPALDAPVGSASPPRAARRRTLLSQGARYRARLETLSTTLRDAPNGVDKVSNALCRLRSRYPRRKVRHQAVSYCRDHRHRMGYAALRAESLPIGSGVVEAACTTLVSQRLKRSGRRWREDGGQAILTLRALCQSDRFDRAWPLLTAMYKRSVRLPHKVIALHGRR